MPVVLLGFVLAGSYRTEARRRGLAEGRSEAELIAQTAIAPLFRPVPLQGRLTPGPGSPYTALTRVAKEAVGKQHVLRLRVRNLAGNVVFSDDGSGFAERPEDEALDAARGEIVARLTHLNSDSNDSGAAGPEAVEVYQPLLVGVPERRIGVLELYLPYAPIRSDVASGLSRLLADLVVGLGALYVVLFAISWSMSRGLRRQAAMNAFLAEHDALTDLPNRRLFHRRVVQALERAQATGTKVAIAIVDLDRFKEINDSLGHHNGDALLVELGRRLTQQFGDHGTVARLGGDEFGLVLDDTADLDATWSRLRQAIGHEVEVSGLPVTVEASIGYVLAPDDGHDVDVLLQRADVALYVAKKQNADAARYDPTQDDYDPANLTLISELRRAIDRDELVLHYQPKARFSDGRFDAVEALIRWQHPTRGLLSPDRFLPLAEPTEIIEGLTDWVLNRALTDIRDLHSPYPLDIAVNVSARSLSRADFPDRVIRALQQTDVAPTRLTIEITETALVADPARAAIALSQLDALGVKISIDDFGTGQTSLAYLTGLPIDELKIDKSFVTDLLDETSHAAIVRSIIDLGHNLNLRVVAEGIETTAVLETLHDAKCDIAQGFLLARPMPVGDLPRFLATIGTITSAEPRELHTT
ncbi:MAG: putative bifunctional diguanylate cyclase/phosphodiesterase [Acidimicrobiia bacterium]